MDRRVFLASLVVAPAVPLIDQAKLEPPKIRRFWKYNRRKDRLQPIAFEQIKAGDEIWIDESDPELSEVVLVSEGTDGKDFFRYSHIIDKKTNQWVPSP
jgi:hypothetical protein